MTKNSEPVHVPSLPPEAFTGLIDEGALVIDTRSADKFCDAFIPGAVWVADPQTALQIIDSDRKVILVTEKGREAAVLQSYLDAGFSAVSASLAGGMSAWQRDGFDIDMLISVDPEELEIDLKYSAVLVLDAREASLRANGKVEGALDIDLAQWHEQSEELPTDKSIYLYSETGKTSLTLASLMKRAGFQRVYQVEGGMQEILKTQIPIHKPGRKKGPAQKPHEHE
jgi:hydroxyacylglutathione hydrolase